MEKDWELVRNKLNTTHLELAGHLKSVLSSPGCRKSDGPCNVTYDTSTLPGNTIHQAVPQHLTVKKAQTNGCQCSLFWNVKTMTSFNDGWSCTYTITNTDTNMSIPTFGTNCDWPQNGTLTWIESFGFYEGSVPFRIPPDTLYQIFSGGTLA